MMHKQTDEAKGGKVLIMVGRVKSLGTPTPTPRYRMIQSSISVGTDCC